MRTQQYINVEAIVAKYKALASNAEAIRLSNSFADNLDPDDYIITNYKFIEQLIGYIYKLRAGRSVNQEVLKSYANATDAYIKGVLDDEEEQFLVKNFNVFIDYAFDYKKNYEVDFGTQFDNPSEWSCLVPYLLENKSKNVFIAKSDYGREFVGLENCDITVGEGFVDAAIRALACGKNIRLYKQQEPKGQLWENIEDNYFDAIIVDIHSASNTQNKNSLVEKTYQACTRIVKDGGEILLCLSRDEILSGESENLRKLLKNERTLHEVIQLHSGNHLLHIVKEPHDSFVMCDASNLSSENIENIVEIQTFIKGGELDNSQNPDNLPTTCRYNYGMLNESILLPTYYLNFQNEGTALEQFADVKTKFVLSDECEADEKVATVNYLSNVFTKGEFKVNDLPNINLDHLRRYYRVDGPAVVMAVANQDIAVGYIVDSVSFLVPRNLYVLEPKNGIDVKYLASQLLSIGTKKQITSLVYGKGLNAKLPSNWSSLVRCQLQTAENQQYFVQRTILDDYAVQEGYTKKKEKSFKYSIRLRKHALSQNISAFDSLFRSLEYCMNEHNGHIKSTDQISPISTMTVGEAMFTLHTKLETICERIAHLTDDNDWGKCEKIEPQQFIEHYEKLHRSAEFNFYHLWEDFETNKFQEDEFDQATGKLLFHKGESMNSAWFPRKALLQVFDNIISNAREHGFNDENRKDYIIQTSWDTDGLNMIIEISNNGTAIAADVDTDRVLDYGYSTALNQRGHGGIGGGEIFEIMQKFGGNVNVISNPDEKFTVTYVLTLPLASLY